MRPQPAGRHLYRLQQVSVGAGKLTRGRLAARRQRKNPDMTAWWPIGRRRCAGRLRHDRVRIGPSIPKTVDSNGHTRHSAADRLSFDLNGQSQFREGNFGVGSAEPALRRQCPVMDCQRRLDYAGMPEAASVWPKVAFSDPTGSGFSRPAPAPYTRPSAPNSTGSPTGVPVPCAST